MFQSGKLMSNLDQQGTKVLNLTVIQRIDPSIQDILLMAAHHVAFYGFQSIRVNGNTEPWFQFIVMNRRNIENLIEDLLGDFECEIQVPYLLYKIAAHEVNGIWFYNPRECEEVASLINRIIASYARIPSNQRFFGFNSESQGC